MKVDGIDIDPIREHRRLVGLEAGLAEAELAHVLDVARPAPAVEEVDAEVSAEPEPQPEPEDYPEPTPELLLAIVDGDPSVEAAWSPLVPLPISSLRGGLRHAAGFSEDEFSDLLRLAPGFLTTFESSEYLGCTEAVPDGFVRLYSYLQHQAWLRSKDPRGRRGRRR